MTEYRHPTLSDEQYNLYLAAPELLAACEAMAEVLDQADDVWWLQDEADQIDAAIAKARGEA